MQIERIEIRNYRAFCHAVLNDLPPMTVVVGANGSGKSTLFDVFSFLKDALTQNVATAVARRGGFRELVSRGERRGRLRSPSNSARAAGVWPPMSSKWPRTMGA